MDASPPSPEKERASLARTSIRTIADVAALHLNSLDAVVAKLPPAPFNTDDRPVVEYRAPIDLYHVRPTELPIDGTSMLANDPVADLGRWTTGANATELPAGWTGFGGPEDPNTFLPQLPPGVTFADVLAGVDEIQIHAIEPGYYYDFGFIYDLDFDNISIADLPRSCDGHEATVFVDGDGIVHGGEYDGWEAAVTK